MLHNPIVELPVLIIKLCIRKYAGLEEVVAEEDPFAEVIVDIRQRRPERLQHHLPVLFADDLISDAASRVDVLLADRLDLGDDLRALRL